jgi:tRNA threonylcarbamoyladenosine modification (KEOPS) complex  Pcc1 subunit
MECRAVIFVKGDAKKLFECLAPEETKFDRSSFIFNKKKDGLEIEVVAKDAVAFRATMSTISQLLTVYEGVGKER